MVGYFIDIDTPDDSKFPAKGNEVDNKQEAGQDNKYSKQALVVIGADVGKDDEKYQEAGQYDPQDNHKDKPQLVL